MYNVCVTSGGLVETRDVCWDCHTRMGMWTQTTSRVDVFGEKLHAAYFCSLVADVCHIRGFVREDRFTSDGRTANCFLQSIVRIFLL